jgi:hypothetical protein
LGGNPPVSRQVSGGATRSVAVPATAATTYDGSKDPANPVSTKLLNFARTEKRYFSTEERDFVAVYSR